MKASVIYSLLLIKIIFSDHVENVPNQIKIDNPKITGMSTKTSSIAYKKIIKETGDDFINIIQSFISRISGSSNYIQVNADAITPNPYNVVTNTNFRFDLQQSQKGGVDNYQLQINKKSSLFNSKGKFTTICGVVFTKPASASNQVYLYKVSAIQTLLDQACNNNLVITIGK